MDKQLKNDIKDAVGISLVLTNELKKAVKKDVEAVENKLQEVETVLTEKVNEAISIAQETQKMEGEKGEKGDRGDTGAKGDKGDKGDKGEKGDTTIVEKVIEKITEVRVEPVVTRTETTVENPYELLGENVVRVINDLEVEPDLQIDAKHIKNLPKTTTFVGGGSSGIKGITAGTNITVDNSNVQYPVISASAPDVSGLVPYTGATQDVNLGDYNLLAEGVVSHDSHGFYFKTQSLANSASFGLGGGQGWTFYDGVKLDSSTADRILSTDSSKNVVALDTATYPSLTELSYVKGVTSSIQTQLAGCAKLDGTNQPFTGNITVGSTSAGKNLSVVATLGTELITAPMVTGGWTLGSDGTGNWSISGGTLTKIASAGTLTATAVTGMTSAPTIGVTYKVTIVCSAVGGGGVTYTLGGVAGSLITAATTYTDYITASTTGKIVLSGIAASTVTITSISIKALTDATGDTTIDGNLTVNSATRFNAPVTLANNTGTGLALIFNPNNPTTGMVWGGSLASPRIYTLVNGTSIGHYNPAGYEIETGLAFTWNNRLGISCPATKSMRISYGGANIDNIIWGENNGTGFGFRFDTTNGAMSLDNGTTTYTRKFGVGIAPASVGALVHFNSTTEQLRVGYDTSNYYKTTVGSTGLVTFDAVGSGSEFLFSDRIRHPGTFAQIYVVDGATAQSIPTGTTYTKLTAFTTDGASSNCTTDATNDKIEITKAGKYLVNLTFSGSVGTANTDWDGAVFYDGTEQGQIHWSRKFATATDIGSTCASGILTSAANKDIDVRVKHASGISVDITPHDMSLTVTYIGE